MPVQQDEIELFFDEMRYASCKQGRDGQRVVRLSTQKHAQQMRIVGAVFDNENFDGLQRRGFGEGRRH